MKIYHDHNEDSNWTRISAIKKFPIIPTRMDETSQISFVIDDFEGALYATWEGYDFIPIKITDEAGVNLFRGFLFRKRYNKNNLFCIARGLSAKLDWTPIHRNYIYKEGTVKTVPHAGNATITLQDIDGDNIGWANDELISGRETGILIRDTSDNWDATVWTVTAISDVNEVSNAGNAADCNTDNGAYYQTNDSGILDAIVTPVITGANIDSTLKKLKEIVITYKIGTYFKGIPVSKTITFEILYNGATWVKIWSRSSGGTDVSEVWTSSTFTLTGTDTELAKYLTKTGVNYDGIVNIRIKMESVTSTAAFVNYVKIDYLKADIRYYETDITPISEEITDNGDTWIEANGIDFTTSGIIGETAPGEKDGDSFMIGFSTFQILNEIFGASNIGLQIDSTLTKYIAQHYKGTNAKEILNKIKLLEGVHWFEDHMYNQVVIAKEADFVDSTEDLTQSNYADGWELEDDNNYYSAVEVYGSAGYNIYYKAIDPEYPTNNKSPMTKTIIEETIMTVAEARDVAEAQLSELKTKRPSIKIPLKGTYTNLRVGKTAGLTMARPTRAEADYPIRMIERERLGHAEIKTTIYCGLGHSTLQEKIADKVNKAIYLAHKAHTDRLVSTNFAPGVMPAFGDVSGITAGVEAIITDELVDGESIDNRIDALITALINTDVWVKNTGDGMTGSLGMGSNNVDNIGKLAVGTIIQDENTHLEGNLLLDAYHNGVGSGIFFRDTFSPNGVNNSAVHLRNLSIRMRGIGSPASPDGLEINGYDGIVFGTGGDNDRMTLVDSGLTMAVLIAMGTNKITGLAKGTNANDALALGTNLSNNVYDAAAWQNITDVAPSKDACRDVFVALTGAVIYMGTWNPNDAAYPTSGIGYYYICSHDGYHALDADGTPERWYEIGDWIIYNTSNTEWDILRNLYGNNVIGVSPGDNIQTAIDEIESVGSGEIVLLPGTHTLTAGLTVNNINVYITIRGLGDSSIVDVGGDWLGINATNFKSLTLKDFKIDCSDQTTVGRQGIYINEVNDNKCVIENITGIGDDLVTSDGIRADSEGVIIRNCNLSTLRYGIYIGGDKCRVYENTVYNCGINGIYITAADYCTFADNNIDGNVEATNYGIYINDSQYISLTDNYIDDCVCGIYLVTQSDKGTYIGNTILNCSGQGIYIHTGDYNSVTGNVITTCGDGIELGAAASNNYITVNMITGSTGEDIDDNSDKTNYILNKDTDINSISLNVYPHGDTRQDGIPYMGTNGDYFYAHFFLGSKVDVSKNITITWEMKREGAWAANPVNLTSQIGKVGSPAAQTISYTNIENQAVTLLINATQRVNHFTRTITGGTASNNDLIAIKAVHNDANNQAMTCLDCHVTYYVKRA